MKTLCPVIYLKSCAALAGVMLAAWLSASWQPALAAPVNSDIATAAVRGWLKAERTPLGEALGSAVQHVDTFKDEAGNELYYVVYLEPSGFVLVPADDWVEPIVGFAPRGKFDPSPDNPLGALVSADIPARVAGARKAAKLAPQAAALQAQGKWQQLVQSAKDGPTANGLAGVSDVRIAPLTQTTWSQQTAASGTTACYNYYTPPYGDGNSANYPAGCVATAMAQLMRYYQFPNTGVGTASFTIYVDGSPTSRALRGGNGSGGVYDWANMPLVPSGSPPAVQCQAIGALVADAGTTVKMQYTSTGSSSVLQDGKNALLSTFHFTAAIAGYNNYADLGAGLAGMVNPNLDARCPVILGIHGSPGGHAVVADGYGYNSSTLYHHLNLGWSGTDTAWYALPTIDTGQGTFSVVDTCVYNVYTNGSGEIISGRVLDQISRPVANATVTATRTGGGVYTATTDSQGIYALARIPSASSYSIAITKTNFTTVTSNFLTGTSADNVATSGNYWGANFTMNMLPSAVDHIVWSTVAATQAMSTPFGVTITAQNATNGPATGFTGPVAVSAYASSWGAANTIIGSLSASMYTYSSSGLTLGYAFTPNTNIQVTAVRYYNADKVSIWTDSGALLTSQAVFGGISWAETPLVAPINLFAGTTYRVSAHYGANVNGYYRTTSWPTTFANGAVGQTFYLAFGDAFPAQDNGTSQGPLVDLRYMVAFSNAVPVAPTSSGTFVNGVWSGNLTASQAVTNVVLKADDGAGHIGLSNPFNVIDTNAVPPTITTQPQSRTNNTGDNAAFSVAASSSQTPGYFWRRNGSPIAGANSSSYTLNNVQLPDSGAQLSCVVTNAYGSRTSQVATLTVICTNVVVGAQPHLALSPAGAVVYAVAPLTDGAVIFGGYFTNVNGITRKGIARLLPDGTLDPAWNPGANGAVLALAASGTNVYVGGAFTNIGGLNRNFIAKLSATGTGVGDATWNPGGADYYVETLAVDGTNVYAGGEFWYMGSQPRNCVAKLSATGAGTVDATWNPNATQYGRVDSLVVSGTNVFIGGLFTNVNGLARTNLAKLNSSGNGAADPTWKPNANGEVYAVAVNGTNVYVGGVFTSVGIQNRKYIAKLSGTGAGAADATWNPSADAAVWSLAVRAASVYAGGSFTNIGGLRRFALAKLSASGSGAADATWDANPDGTVYALASCPTNLEVAGIFTQMGGQPRPGIASLTFPPLRLTSPQRASGGQFQFTVTGEAGQGLEILASTNLTSWTSLLALTNSTGTTNFTDPTTNLPRRLYRAHQLQ